MFDEDPTFNNASGTRRKISEGSFDDSPITQISLKIIKRIKSVRARWRKITIVVIK